MATQRNSRTMGTLATAGRQPLESLFGFAKSSVLGSISLVLLALLMFVGLFPQAIAPYGPDELFYVNLKQPPSWDHWAGTDFISRDSLTRIIFGARITLLVAFVSVFIGDAVGFTWGVMSGYLAASSTWYPREWWICSSRSRPSYWRYFCWPRLDPVCSP